MRHRSATLKAHVDVLPAEFDDFLDEVTLDGFL
jgi:hypothetical protein